MLPGRTATTTQVLTHLGQHKHRVQWEIAHRRGKRRLPCGWVFIDVDSQLIARVRAHRVVRGQLPRHLERQGRVQAAALVDVCELAQLHHLALGRLLRLALLLDVRALRVGLLADRDKLADGHGERACRWFGAEISDKRRETRACSAYAYSFHEKASTSKAYNRALLHGFPVTDCTTTARQPARAM